jgi:hypothetical protein
VRYILSLNLPSCELVDSAVAADIPVSSVNAVLLFLAA